MPSSASHAPRAAVGRCSVSDVERLIRQAEYLIPIALLRFGGISDHDLVSEAYLGIWEAALKFDPRKGRVWSSWAYMHIEFAAMRVQRWRRRQKRGAQYVHVPIASPHRDAGIDIPATENDDWAPPASVDELARRAGLTDAQRRVLDAVRSGMSQVEVASSAGVAPQAVSMHLSRATRRLRRAWETGAY